MSIPLTAALYALAASLAPLLLLALRDPKRLRVSGGDRSAAHATRTRQALALLSLLPGALLFWSRDGPGLLVWAGALPCLGWALVLLLSARGRARN